MSKHKHISNYGYIISKNNITKEDEKKIIKDLTITPKVLPIYADFIKPKPYKIYYHNENYLYLPLYYGIQEYGPYIKNHINIGEEINIKMKGEPLAFQKTAADKLLNIYNKENDLGGGILSLPCGYGKCHGKDTKILCYSGLIKNVQDIIPYDLLMGDDGTPRIVISTTIGYGDLYNIIPEDINLTPYSVNDEHILSLMDSDCNVINMNMKEFIIKNKTEILYGYTNKGTKHRLNIEYIGTDNYYGFNISGNNLYCLGDGQITHNTFLSLYTAANLGYKTLVLVSKEFIRDQWINAINKFTTATSGIIQQNKLELDNEITVAMIHTICLKDFNNNLFNRYGFLIIDECHHLSSEMFIKSLMKIRTRFILGLSATPERRDGLSHVFYKFIGELIHKEKRTENNNVLIQKININGGDLEEYITLYNSQKVKDTGKMITNLCNSNIRNIFIIHILKYLIKLQRTILILSGRREHLHLISNLLDKEELKIIDKQTKLPRAITYGFYYGNLGGNKKEHTLMLEETAKCDIILGTDAIAKEALDIPSLNTLIFASPAGVDVEQSVGRILRKIHDCCPTVIDLVDLTGNFEKHYKEREKWYENEEYVIEELFIDLKKYEELQLADFLINHKSNAKLVKLKKKKMAEIEELCNEMVFEECLLDIEATKATKLAKAAKAANEKPKKINKLKKQLNEIEKKEKQKEELFDMCLL
jgi:superfamily II DNA or RNA helicase